MSANDATLLDVLVDGFEKNEVLHGVSLARSAMPDGDRREGSLSRVR